MQIFTNSIQYINEPVLIYSDFELDLPSEVETLKKYIRVFAREGMTEYVPLDVETFSVSSISQTVLSLSCSAFEPNKFYMIGIVQLINSETILKQLTILVLDRTAIANSNNTFTQLKSIDKLLDVEYLIKNSSEYQLSFNPTYYNNELQNYEYDTTNLIEIKNNELILDELIKQYFSEYKIFYETINKRNSDININKDLAGVYSDEYIQNLHLLFMKHITKWYALKGNKYYIELLIGLYCKFLGHILLSVIEEKSNNCRYRISTTIPKNTWNRVIKPLVHPLSWSDIYSEIDEIVDGTHTALPPDLRTILRSDCISYNDVENYSRTRNKYALKYNRFKDIYHVFGNIESFNVSAHENLTHRLCSLRQKYDETEFKMYLNSYVMDGVLHESYASSSELFLEMIQKNLLDFTIDRINKTANFTYKLPGIADEYNWDIYRGNSIIYTIKSLPNFVKNVPFEPNDRLELQIGKHSFKEVLFILNQVYFTDYVGIKDVFLMKNQKRKFLSVKLDNTFIFTNDGISNVSYASENGYPTISISTVGDEEYLSPSNSATFISSFDTSGSVVLTKTAVAGGYKIDCEYVHPGIAMKYEWTLKQNSNEVRKTTSYLNKSKFLIADTTNTSINLRIYFRDGYYDLSNTFLVP